MQTSEAVCGDVPRVTLAGRLQLSPVGVGGEKLRFTVPVKPFIAVTVIIDVPEQEGPFVLQFRSWAGVTVPAEIAKSTTWNSMLAVV